MLSWIRQCVSLIFVSILCDILLFSAIPCECRIESSYFTSIYSSTYTDKLDTPDSLSLFTSITITSKTHLTFITAQSSGILVLNEAGKLIYSAKQAEPIEKLSVTSDGRFVFFMENSRLCVYEFLQSQETHEYSLTKIFELDKDYSDVVEFTFDPWEKRAVAAAVMGNILLFDTSNLDNSDKSKPILKLLDIVHIDPTLRGINISSDLKWLILGEFTHGVMVFRWVDSVGENETLVPKDKLDIYLVAVCDTVSPSKMLLTSDNRYLMMIQYWDGFSIIDLNAVQIMHSASSKLPVFDVISLVPIVPNYWPKKSQPNGHALAISADERFVAIGERSVALYIVDVSDRANPQLFQTILANYFSLAVAFSKDDNENYLIYSNGYSILRFKKSKPNLNIDEPNLYNVHRSVNNVVGNSKWRWIGRPDPKGEFFFSTDYDDTFYIMDLRNSKLIMDSFTHIDTNGSSVDNFLLFNGSVSSSSEAPSSAKYLALPTARDTTFLDIYDISTMANMKLVASIPFSIPQYSYSMDFDDNKQLLVFDQGQQVIIVSTANLSKPTPSVSVLSIWEFPTGLFTFLNGAQFSYDCKYLILLERVNALVLVNIEDPTKPEYTTKMITLGGEVIVKGKYQYVEYLFLADGLTGIKIIDQRLFPQITIIGSVEVRGYASHVTLLNNGNFILASSFDKGQITLIDISTITSPKVVSTLQYQEEVSVSTSVLESFDYFYIENKSGVRAVPLFSETYIHTDIQQVLNSQTGTPTLISLDKDTIFQVGQIINMNFLILHPVEGIRITGVFYLQYYDVIDIPYWMKFNSADYTLQLTIVKDSLGSNYSSSAAKVQSNTILIETHKPVLVSDFYFQVAKHGVDISQNQAGLIWNFLRSSGFLDKHAFVTSLFEYESEFVFSIEGVNTGGSPLIHLTSGQESRLFALVKLALSNSIMYNPIIFQTKASLSIEVNPTPQKNSTNPENLDYIVTVLDYVYLYLTIDKSLGKFVPKAYSGIITSTTTTLDQIKLEGDPANINLVLSSKVELYLYAEVTTTSNNSTITNVIAGGATGNSNNYSSSVIGLISLRLTDSLNYEISQEYDLSKVSFISYHPKIKKNTETSLQEQFSKRFVFDVIDIKSTMEIEFSSNTFIAAASSQLAYSAFLVNDSAKSIDDDSNLSAIPEGFWMTFQPKLLKFTGTPQYDNYNEQYCFVIEVTDTFSSQRDRFCLVASGIPLVLVLNVILQYIGPVLFVLGFDRYKHVFYNIFLAQKNLSEIQSVKLNQPFQMRILFVGQNLLMAEMIFKNFLKINNSTTIQKKKSNAQNTSRNQKSNSQLNHDEEYQEEDKMKCKTLTVSTGETTNRQMITQQGQYTESGGGGSSSRGGNYSERGIPPKNSKTMRESIRKYQEMLKNENIPEPWKRMISIVNSIQETQSAASPNQSPMEQMYIDPITKQVLFERFLQDVVDQDIQFKINGHVAKVSSMKNDILSPTHLLNWCLRSMLARYLLEKDRLTSQVYEFMRTDAITNSRGKEFHNSWYKKYVHINHNQTAEGGGTIIQTPGTGISSPLQNQKTKEENQQIEDTIFPKISLKIKAIRSFIENLEIPREFKKNQSVEGEGKSFDQKGVDQSDNKAKGLQILIVEVNQQKFNQKIPSAKEDSIQINGRNYLPVNRHLIEQMLLADAFGLKRSMSSMIFPSLGESLHMNEHEISSVEAFVLSEEKTYFAKLRRWLNLEYVRITSHENRKLPVWIDYKLKKDILLLEGIPIEEEKNEFLIRFYDQRKFIVKQFKLNIIRDHFNKIRPKLDMLLKFNPNNNENNNNQRLEAAAAAAVSASGGTAETDNIVGFAKAQVLLAFQKQEEYVIRRISEKGEEEDEKVEGQSENQNRGNCETDSYEDRFVVLNSPNGADGICLPTSLNSYSFEQITQAFPKHSISKPPKIQ